MTKRQSTLIDRPASPFRGPEILTDLVLPLSWGATEISLDFETTAKTPWVHGDEIPGGKIGGKLTPLQYSKKWGCTLDPTPRGRVLTLSIPTAHYACAADLDLFSPDEKRVLADLLTGHVWVGHNLGFDYQWMLTLNPDTRPARIVDTMLMVTAMRPDAMYCMQELVVKQTIGGLDTRRKHFSELSSRTQIRAAKKEMSSGTLSLDDLALWLFDEKLDKAFQKPVNWMPEYLSPEHHDYCMGDVNTPQKAARVLLGLPHEATISEVLRVIDRRYGGAAYKDMEAALHVMVRMQRKGLYWSQPAAQKLEADLAQEAVGAMEHLVSVAPGLTAFREQLLDTDTGLTEDLKNAIGSAIHAETGQSLPTTAKGNASLNANDLKLSFPGSKVVAALQNVLQAVSEQKRVPQYALSVADDGRIHPLTGINTITGRTSSQEPNLQNIPRDKRFRAIFAAPDGFKIMATDFSSIELRIAAALGVRAWRVLQGLLAGLRGDPKMQKALKDPLDRTAWLFRAVPELQGFLQNPGQPIPPRIANADPSPSVYDNPPIEAWALASAQTLCIAVSKIYAATGGDEAKLPFRLAYDKKLDPHIVTALKMEEQGGRFDLRGLQPIEYLEALPHDERKGLKTTLKDPRQAAKAVGFGLIYGMSADSLWSYGIQSYGLSWSKEDAGQAKDAYFDLFPEIGLWHWLLKNAFKVKADILNPYNSSECRSSSEGGKLYAWYTLSGRPTIASKLTSGLNYQDQGTGAEIAFRSLTMLPPDVQGMLVNFVHDELVLEVPEDRVDEVQGIVERTMIAAADSLLLKYGIPTEVETETGDCWIH